MVRKEGGHGNIYDGNVRPARGGEQYDCRINSTSLYVIIKKSHILMQKLAYEVLSFGVTFPPNLQKLIPPSVGSMDFQDW